MDFETVLSGFFRNAVDEEIESVTYTPEAPVKLSCPIAGQENLITEITGSRKAGVFRVKANNGRFYRVDGSAKLSVYNVPEDSEILTRQFPRPPKVLQPINDSEARREFEAKDKLPTAPVEAPVESKPVVEPVTSEDAVNDSAANAEVVPKTVGKKRSR